MMITENGKMNQDIGIAAKWFPTNNNSWTIRRLKHILSNNDGGVWGDDTNSIEEGIIVLRSTDVEINGKWNITNPARRKLSSTEYSSGRLLLNDLLMTKSSGSELHLGKTALVSNEVVKLNCCFSNFMQRLRVRSNLVPKFVFWFLNSSIGREQLNYFGSTTTGLNNLTGNLIGNLLISVPPPKEQQAIAEFLDRETARIDALIAKYQRMLGLLDEKRSSLINQVVTKGLDPSVPIKDSGVEWLGDIPAHWHISPLFASASEQKRKNRKNRLSKVLSLSYGRIVERDVSTNFGLLPETFDTYQVIEPGNIILRLTDLQNDKHSLRVGLVKDFGIITSAYICLQFKSSVNPNFAYYLLHNYDIWKVFYFIGSGVRQTIDFDDLKRLHIVVPPLNTQHDIVCYLNREIQKIDDTKAKINLLINKLKDYRTSLISNTVTGKIDVKAFS